MIDIHDVVPVLSVLSGKTEEELASLSLIINNAISVVAELADGENLNCERLIFLAAAKANYDISLASNCSDGITSFRAGDISITQSRESISCARAILDDAMKNASDIISDNGFAFLGV